MQMNTNAAGRNKFQGRVGVEDEDPPHKRCTLLSMDGL